MMPELQKEIRLCLLRNPFPDTAISAIANLVLGFTLTQVTGLNNPANYLQVDEPDDACVIELIHMPLVNITGITTTAVLTPYINQTAEYIRSWLEDPKQRIIAGSMRLHWLLQPTSNINGLLYCMMKGIK